MDAIQSFMQRRRGLNDAASLGRDQRTLMRRSRSIGGVRNVATDSAGNRVVMPTSAQVGAGRTPDWFKRSMAPSRADRVRESMVNGTFGGIRDKFNAASKDTEMNAAGDIVRKVTASTATPASPAATGTTPAATTAPTPAPAFKPKTMPAGPPAATGRIKDETGDVTGRIMGSMAAKAKPTNSPAAVSPQMASLTGAATTLNKAEDLAKKTQGLLNKSRAPGRV